MSPQLMKEMVREIVRFEEIAFEAEEVVNSSDSYVEEALKRDCYLAMAEGAIARVRECLFNSEIEAFEARLAQARRDHYSCRN